MNSSSPLLHFLKLVATTTLGQLAWLLGVLLIFGFALYAFARLTRITYAKTGGTALNIAITGWIGTPVHELGHAIFCLIFGHRITGMKLYNPNSGNGTLGYVSHSYNPTSTYQKIGNFFIGIGPVILGATILYALLHLLVPNNTSILLAIEEQGQSLARGVRGEWAGVPGSLWSSTLSTLGAMFSKENLSDYKFWIFLYLAVSIASHIELSPADIKGARRGLVALVVLTLVLNTVTLGLETTGLSAQLGSGWRYFKLEYYATAISQWVGTLGAMLAFASTVSGLNFLVTYIGLSAYSLARKRGAVNPLW